MKKPFIILTAASVLALASCGGGAESSSHVEVSSETASSAPASSSASSEASSSAPTKIVPSVELAAQKLAELQEKTVTHYLLSKRAYQDSYIDGTVVTNNLDTMEIHSYDGAFEGEETVEQLSGIIETTPLSDSKGRVAGYYLDEESFAYGYNWDDDHASDALNICEVNRYLNPNAIEEGLYSGLIDQVAATFEDIESAYPVAMGFTHNEPTIEEENGCFRITLGATAPEEGYYGREEGTAYCCLDIYSGDVVELGTTMLLYDMGYTDPDPEVSANNVTNNTMVIYETGERAAKSVEPLDESVIPAANITSSIRKKVEGLETGTLSEESVLAILSNVAAYAEGVTKDEFTVETSALTDTITYESLGAATGTGTATVDGDVYSETTTYELSDGTEVVQSVTNEATDEGVRIVASQNGTVVADSTMPGLYVTNWSSYFTPGPFTATGSVACSIHVINSAIGYGFGEFDDGFNAGTQTLLEATNIDGKIKIAIESTSTSFLGTTETSFSFEIVDGILATVEGTRNQEVTLGDVSETTITTERHVLSAA